jgi:multiple sugar transport system permease protein
MMAAASLAALPVVIAFLLFQRHIIKGISLTGLAGR